MYNFFPQTGPIQSLHLFMLLACMLWPASSFISLNNSIFTATSILCARHRIVNFLFSTSDYVQAVVYQQHGLKHNHDLDKPTPGGGGGGVYVYMRIGGRNYNNLE